MVDIFVFALAYIFVGLVTVIIYFIWDWWLSADFFFACEGLDPTVFKWSLLLWPVIWFVTVIAVFEKVAEFANWLKDITHDR